MKRIISVITSLLLTFVSVSLTSQSAMAVCGLAGSGTQNAPWQISSQADLAQAGLSGTCQTNANQNQFYELTADVALTGNWTPLNFGLGTGTGGLDGNGFTISGLNVSMAGNYAGLFGILKNSTVTDLTIKVGSVAGNTWVGALAGLAQYSTIQNVNILGTGSTIISGSTGAGNGQAVGGAIGYTLDCTISGVSIKALGGSVRGTDYYGGLIGTVEGGSVSDLGSRVNVSRLSGGSGIAGGVIGKLVPKTDVILDGLFFGGTISSDFMVGGLIGYAFSNSGNHNVTISNSGVRGSISTQGNYNPAALIGEVGNSLPNITLLNNYSTASYSKNTSTSATVIASAGLTNGNGSISASGNAYEVSAGSGINSSQATQVSFLNDISLAPLVWSKASISSGVISTQNVSWLFDSAITSILNDGRPMVKNLYNASFWNDSVCDPGYYDAASNGVCVAAALGNFVAMRGLFAQIPCNYGSYTSSAASTVCLLAPPGRFVGVIGGSLATVCPLGEYQPNAGSFQCIAAPIGSYVDVTQATAPTPCPAGKTTSAIRAVSLSACVSPAPATYSGPLVTSVQAKTYANGEVELPGNNLSGITAVKIDSISVPFEVRDKKLVLHIPAGVTLGVKSIAITSSSGLITVEGALNITEKPIDFAVSFGRVKNKVTASISSPTNFVLKLNGAEVASQRGSGILKKVLTLKKGKNYVDVFKNGVLEKRALFTVK